jgi:hypothetical protein
MLRSAFGLEVCFFGHGIFVTFWSAFMTGQEAPKKTQDSTRGLQNGPRSAQGASKKAQDYTRGLQNGPTSTQDGSNKALRMFFLAFDNRLQFGLVWSRFWSLVASHNDIKNGDGVDSLWFGSVCFFKWNCSLVVATPASFRGQSFLAKWCNDNWNSDFFQAPVCVT